MVELTESSSLVRRPESGKYGGITQHNWTTFLLVIGAFVTFIVTAAFNGLNGSGAALGSVFVNTVGNISDKYHTYVTPAGFTFSIWSVIYLWIAISLIALIVSLFLSNQKGRLYLNPVFASPLLTVTMSVNFVLNLIWIFIWDREYLIAAAVILILIALTNIAVVGFMARNIQSHSHEYIKGSDMFLWGILYRFMMNGFAVYTTWTVIASLLNFTIALVYVGETDLKATSIAALSLLVVFHVTWFILENFVLDKYVRYLLTPYLVVMWASNGIRADLASRPDSPQEVYSFVLSILIIASATMLIRLIIFLYRTFRKSDTQVGDLAAM